MKPEKFKRYFKNELIHFELHGNTCLGRVSESNRHNFFVTVFNPTSKKLVTVEVPSEDILGKVPESMNTDFLPVHADFAVGNNVYWVENGVKKVAKVIDTKGHKTLLETIPTKDFLEISTVSLNQYKGNFFAEHNSMAELEGFYIKTTSLDENGETIGFIIAHGETRVASAIRTEFGFRLSSLDIVSGHVQFERILSIWAKNLGLHLKDSSPVELWANWLTHYWSAKGVSDYQYADAAKCKKVA